MTTQPPVMTQYVVYAHPLDAPDLYVAREWLIYPGQEPVAGQVAISGSDLDLIRAWLTREGLYRLDRFPEDDPSILEVWI